MVHYTKHTDAPYFFLLTECGLTSRLQLELPQKHFVGSCTMCKYMKSNTLADIIRVLKNPDPIDFIHIDKQTAKKALSCVEAMFYWAEK